ncbi:MFS transporter, partial [Acinetobacter johnsonii]
HSLGEVSPTTVFALYMVLGFFSGTVGLVSYSMVKMLPAPIRFSGISFSYNVAYAIAGGITLPLVQWLRLYSNIGAMYYIWLVCLVCLFTALVYRTRFENKP